MIQYLVSLFLPLGYIIIPSISLYKPIEYLPITNQVYDTSELGYSIAFLEGTIWEDTSWGRTVLIGHTPGGFQDLTELTFNDRIILITNNYEYEYYVVDITIIYESDVSWLAPMEHHELLLMTCHPEGWLLVRAKE
jgi:LPXTG-site transpeptidase (sortase) family protein